jgi:uncharacterized protein YbaP (TraB family)
MSALKHFFGLFTTAAFLWSGALHAQTGSEGAPAPQAPAEVATIAPAAAETAASPPATLRPDIIDNVLVSGEQPGPSLWKVSKDDHVLWILGTWGPLPKRITWRSRKVAAIIEQSQEIITEVDVSADIGFFQGLLLLPAALGVRKNPDGATLSEILPPELYARWLVQKEKYLGRDKGIERFRPIFAAGELFSKAIEQSGLSYDDVVWPVVRKLAKKNDIKITTPGIKLSLEKPRAALKKFSKMPLEDLKCFEATITRLETDMYYMGARANAWSKGDLQTLRNLPYPDQFITCGAAVFEGQVLETVGLKDLPDRFLGAWVEAAEKALTNNTTTFAVLSITELNATGGRLAKLREKGYKVEPPLE